jgi:hypothetical protein
MLYADTGKEAAVAYFKLYIFTYTPQIQKLIRMFAGCITNNRTYIYKISQKKIRF